MSTTIHKVSYRKEDARPFIEKFGDLLGVHKVAVTMQEGVMIEGIISEVGKDYIVLIEGNQDTIIPVSKILYCRYEC